MSTSSTTRNQLDSALRKTLEREVLRARRIAESASRAALDGLGVFSDRRPEHLDASRCALRKGLRAKWKQFGGGHELLVAACAYEQWHRLLFARILAENNLLLHPQYCVPVTLADCEELAVELGHPDGWSIAGQFAAEILPGIFRLDDPCVRLRLAPESRHALERILDGLPPSVFVADDVLGWVYQHWQKDQKDEINASERKIGGADIGPVTQLFTENYMVRFLLENSLGAWWAARHPDSPLLGTFEYLRFDDNGHPAAGSFDGWPDRVAEVTVMDPCCGSGHFLVEAFSMLWQMRAEDEGLSPVGAQDAVLRDNLFGLEIDPRCVQIAMFAVVLQAWKAGGSWRQIPVPNIACSGIPAKAPVEEWVTLAHGDPCLERSLRCLHYLFSNADTLGSLIDPISATEASGPAGHAPCDDVGWAEIEPILTAVSRREDFDPATSVLGANVVGTTRAGKILSRKFTLVATNVPYLKRGNQSELLRVYLDQDFETSRADLGVAMFQRFGNAAISHSLVLPQAWTFTKTFVEFRRSVLAHTEIGMLVPLGPGAFQGVSGEVVKPVLLVASRDEGPRDAIATVDVSAVRDIPVKMVALSEGSMVWLGRRSQLRNPESRVIFAGASLGTLMGDLADCAKGFSLGDGPRYQLCFWEIVHRRSDWVDMQSTVSRTVEYGGRSWIVRWESGTGALAAESSARIQGTRVWGKDGVLVSLMNLRVSIYSGGAFDQNSAVLVPHNAADLPALWLFCGDEMFMRKIRAIDRTLKVTNASLAQIPFDVEFWRAQASELLPDGLPQPWSDDPTQWLFDGRPDMAMAPLQVAVARLLGYRWPEQADSDDLDRFADADGIVCLSSVAGEAPAAGRVQQLLSEAFREVWSQEKVKDLLERTGSKRKNLTDWLRDEFFREHCALFGNRPFVWQIWDGLRDGFSALVNYHRLDRRTLEKLTYTYLGQDWVERQRAEVRDEVAGAEERLTAALALRGKLEAILEGEKPYDIYVRWKEPHEQPIGWDPDLNDGVRLNIRPFVEAGVLRAPFNIHWRKDRGKNQDGSARENDKHLTLGEKHEARQRAGLG